MRNLIVAENIHNWVKEQSQAQQMAAWNLAHPDQATALSFAFKCAKECGYTPDNG